MRKLPLLLWLVSFMAIAPKGISQTAEYKHAISYKGFMTDFLTAEDRLTKDLSYFSRNRNMSPGIEIGYYHYLNKSFNVGIPYKIGTSALEEANYEGKKFSSLDADLIYKLNNGYILNENAVVAPYLYLGFGGRKYKRETQKFDWQIPLGVGISFRLTEEMRLILNAERTNSLSTKRTSLQYQAGVVFLIGKKKDMDNDGVSDDKDICPTVPGLAALSGCPDADGDGITDLSDNCPTEAGVAILSGCPDKDNDGISDNLDQCPEEAGKPALNGCPDDDNDGIANAKDKCPTEIGLPTTDGCPDDDNDGIANDKDKCPTDVGQASLNGCPDSDNDGIVDVEDKCPDIKGLASFEGCPDNDGDGIPDKDDKCPIVKGLLTFEGCPDSDEDGIKDSEDSCPTQAGAIANKGCPEILQEDKKALIDATEIEFETGIAKFTGDALAILDKVVIVLNKYPDYKLKIEGHSDNVGAPAFNQLLSEDQAKACYEYLISKGIKAQRLTYIGFGDTKPLTDNNTEEGRKKNRRVEFIPYVN